MDNDSFIVHVKTDDIYKDVTEDVETRLNTSSYKLDRPLPKRETKKGVQNRFNERWIRWKKHEIISRSYLRDNNDEGKIVKGTKMCLIKKA